jgi:CheY-like chemotaxis protein
LASARKILVVEDDTDLADAMVDLLTEAGYRVMYAHDGAEALGVLKTKTPDLILLDLMMPWMNGWEFLEHQARDQRLSAIPVLVLSALDRAEREIEAAGFLRKPITAEQLLMAVDRLSRPKSA